MPSESRSRRWSFACKANSRPGWVTGPFALRARLQRSGPPIPSESRIRRWSFACKANSRPWRVMEPFALRSRLQRSGPPHPERITNPPLELCLQSEFTPVAGNGALRLAIKAPAIRTSPSRANHESAVGALLAKRIHARGGQRSLSPCEQGSNGFAVGWRIVSD